jgi:UDP-N-acetylglucosamine 2-epimerase (non-hydrolysing)
MKKKILAIVGTRPEAVKMAPVIRALEGEPDRFELTVMATGQHRQMLDQVLGLFRIVPDLDLDLMIPDQTVTRTTCRVLEKLERYFGEHRFDAVLAQGDTTTVMAAATACFYARLPFGHVEAGLRTGDLAAPYPEEFNRRVADLTAAWHFAPTRWAADNLLREGTDPGRVHVTGNTVIDALFHILQTTRPPDHPIPEDRRYVLMTCHRRENFGEPIREIFAAVGKFAGAHPEISIWYPVHPNPHVRGPAAEILGGIGNVLLTEPLDYLHFVHAMNRAELILSDSGGVQEEAPSLGKPVLVLREKTERPEAGAAGTCRLVGHRAERIISSLEQLLFDPRAYRAMSGKSNPYGDGHAAQAIAGILREELGL